MNAVDLLVVTVLGAGAVMGAMRGVLRSAGDSVSLLLGLFVTALVYPLGGWLLRVIGLPANPAAILSFVATTIAVVFGSSYLISHYAEQLTVRPQLERLGGGTAGLVSGVVLLAAFLPVLATSPNAASQLAASRLASPFMAGIPAALETADRIGVPLPKMVLLPTRFELEGTPQMRHGLQLLRINFARLDGMTCIECRGRMRFLGYLRRFPPALSPKFQCEQCSRTTDGCQGFQGMHALYGDCPVSVAKRGRLLDCGVWTNNRPVWPLGRCPVCGQELTKIPQPAERTPTIGDLLTE